MFCALQHKGGLPNNTGPQAHSEHPRHHAFGTDPSSSVIRCPSKWVVEEELFGSVDGHQPANPAPHTNPVNDTLTASRQFNHCKPPINQLTPATAKQLAAHTRHCPAAGWSLTWGSGRGNNKHEQATNQSISPNLYQLDLDDVKNEWVKSRFSSLSPYVQKKYCAWFTV